MHTLQGLFGHLCVPLQISEPFCHKNLLEICVRLSNICACCVGISQIQSVYLPVWKECKGEEMWEDLGNLIFGEIRKHNCVSHFHLELVDKE